MEEESLYFWYLLWVIYADSIFHMLTSLYNSYYLSQYCEQISTMVSTLSMNLQPQVFLTVKPLLTYCFLPFLCSCFMQSQVEGFPARFAGSFVVGRFVL